jgi:cell division protein ZapA
MEAVTVRIGGEDHTIRANTEPEYTRRCARWVDERIGEIRHQLGLIESHKAAILAALSITDELFQARREVEELREDVARKAYDLAGRLEGATHASSVPGAETKPGEPDGSSPSEPEDSRPGNGSVGEDETPPTAPGEGEDLSFL